MALSGSDLGRYLSDMTSILRGAFYILGHVYGPTKKPKTSVLIKKENCTPIIVTQKAILFLIANKVRLIATI
jgi:hypothetical protein